MEVTITARRCTVPDPVRQRTDRLMRRIDRYEARVTSAAVNFDDDHAKKIVEARLAVAGGPPLLAHGEGPTFRSALDGAIQRLERQLKRQRQRRRRRRVADRASAGRSAAS